jgi:hypothetical protein
MEQKRKNRNSIDLCDKGLKMDNDQRLYFNKIYQINRKLEEFKQVCGIEKKRLVSFNILNPYNRKFNWYVVNNNRWEFDAQIIQNINDCMDCEQLKPFYEELKKLNIEELVDSIKYFENGERKNGNSSKKKMKDFHFHLLNLYQYYPHQEDGGIDGVVYRNFKSKKKRLLYTKGELLTKYNNFDIYPWINMTFIYEFEKEIMSLSSQEQQLDGKVQDVEFTKKTFNNEIEKIKSSKPYNFSSRKKVYFNYIVPLIMGYFHPDLKKEELFDGKRYGKKSEKFLLEDDTIKDLIKRFKYILCFPVYDAFIGKRLYGNFCGNSTIFFEIEDDRNAFLEKHEKEIEDKKKIEENLFLLVR